jgi:hypothetical protein
MFFASKLTLIFPCNLVNYEFSHYPSQDKDIFLFCVSVVAMQACAKYIFLKSKIYSPKQTLQKL